MTGTRDTRAAAAYLVKRKKAITAGAESALAVRGPHYAACEPVVIHERIASLHACLVGALQARDWSPLLDHARHVAAERFRGGYDLSEVQAAFNAYEEAIWALAFADLGARSYSTVLPGVSAALGAAKDALAQEYVALAATAHATRLDLGALARG